MCWMNVNLVWASSVKMGAIHSIHELNDGLQYVRYRQSEQQTWFQVAWMCREARDASEFTQNSVSLAHIWLSFVVRRKSCVLTACWSIRISWTGKHGKCDTKIFPWPDLCEHGLSRKREWYHLPSASDNHRADFLGILLAQALETSRFSLTLQSTRSSHNKFRFLFSINWNASVPYPRTTLVLIFFAIFCCSALIWTQVAADAAVIANIFCADSPDCWH
jgi:hypothetical protein